MTTETLASTDTTDPAPTVGATTTIGDLYRIVEAVLPFVEGDHIPAINCVRLEVGGGVLAATATNRVILAHARGVARGVLPAVYLRPGNAQGLLDALRPFLNPDLDMYLNVNVASDLTLYVDGDWLVVEAGSVRISPRLADVDGWPDMHKVFANSVELEPVLNGPILVDPRQIRALPDMGSTPYRLTFAGQFAPIRVEVGDWFVALVMPIKPRNGEPTAEHVPFGLPASNIGSGA